MHKSAFLHIFARLCANLQFFACHFKWHEKKAQKSIILHRRMQHPRLLYPPLACTRIFPTCFRASFRGKRRPEEIPTKNPRRSQCKISGKFEEKIHKLSACSFPSSEASEFSSLFSDCRIFSAHWSEGTTTMRSLTFFSLLF